jgi:hypothetical protein
MSEVKTEKNYGSIVIPFVVEAKDFWSNVLGSGWEDAEHWRKWKYSEGSDWQTPGLITLWCEDPEDYDKTLKKELNIDDLVRGYVLAIEDGFHHCGGYKMDWEDLDLCSSDGILQFAFFGKLIYG